MLRALTTIVEALKRPGMNGAVGVRRENICAKDLRSYFRELAARINDADMGTLANSPSVAAARHGAEMKVRGITRRIQPVLLQALSVNLYHAMLEGDRDLHVSAKLTESTDSQMPPGSAYDAAMLAAAAGQGTGVSTVDDLGLSGQEAADWAAQYSASLVKGIDGTTMNLLSNAVADGIEDQLGVDGLGRLIRKTVMDMSVSRSAMIATTEMNAAFSEAAIRKMTRLGIEYKALVTFDPCDICADNDDDGPIPVDDEFSSGDLRPPFHPNCRCALVPSRAPTVQ